MYSGMGVKSSNTYGCNCAAEAINTTFNTSVKVEQWQDMDIETLTDLRLFIIVDHKKLKSWMHSGKLIDLCAHLTKKYYININLCRTCICFSCR